VIGLHTRRLIAGWAVTALLAAGFSITTAGSAAASVSQLTNNGVYTFTLGSLSMDVEGASLDNNARVLGYPTATGGENQKFELRYAQYTGGLHYYYIVSRHTYNAGGEAGKKCLDVANGSTGVGAGVIQYTCNGGNNQKFALMKNGSNLWAIRALHSQKYIGAQFGGQLVQVDNAVHWDLKKTSFSFLTNWTHDIASLSGKYDHNQYRCWDGWRFRSAGNSLHPDWVHHQVITEQTLVHPENLQVHQTKEEEGSPISAYPDLSVQSFYYNWAWVGLEPVQNYSVDVRLRLFCDPV
jgi:hypothetical protein